MGTESPPLSEHEWVAGSSESAFGDGYFDGEALPVEFLGRTVETPLGPAVYTLDRNGEPRAKFNLECEREGCLRYLVLFLGYNGSVFTYDGRPVADLRNEGFVCEAHRGVP